MKEEKIEETISAACDYVIEKLKSESAMSESESDLVSRLFDTLVNLRTEVLQTL